MTTLLLIVVAIATVPVALGCLYLLAMTLFSGRLPGYSDDRAEWHFVVVVPAHNEELGIERTVQSLKAVAWPQERCRILVIADNCTDRTAEIAQAAGAEVLVRTSADRRGKGYALEFAFEQVLADRSSQAIVVVDADSVVSENLLQAMASRLDAGAQAVQCHYGALNPMDSWRTRLMSVALACFHIVRSRARERFSLSCGIRGNGWCVTVELLRKVPYCAYSLAEDIEFGMDIALRAGARVYYADEAFVLGDMVSSSGAAAKQRQRWEAGRAALVRSHARTLLTATVSRRDPVCADLLADLVLPPLSTLVIALAAVATATGCLIVLGSAGARWLAVADALGVAALLAYVGRGWQLSGIGLRGVLDFMRVPWFVVWKVWTRLTNRSHTQWVRTERRRP